MNVSLWRKIAIMTGLTMLILNVSGFPLNITSEENATAFTSCSRECNNDTVICGTDGRTYLSDCHLKHYNCENQKNITIKREGSCRNCTQHKHSLKRSSLFPNMSDDQFSEHYYSISEALFKRCKPQKPHLKPDELLNFPFNPECYDGENNHIFKPLQQMFTLKWCVTPDGDPILDTLSKKEPECSNRRKCIINNSEYTDGTSFVGKCGPCLCSNGNVTCIDDYCIDEGSLTNGVFRILKDDLLQLFMREYQYTDYVVFDLFSIRAYHENISQSSVLKLVNWKFDQYNSNKDDVLQLSDKTNLHRDVTNLIKTTSVLSELDRLLDADSNGVISRKEMIKFFTHSELEDSGAASGSGLSKRSH